MISRRILIDASALVGLYLRRDQHHEEAVRFWNELEREGEGCITTNLILAEALTLVGRRAGYRFAAQKARTLYSSRAFTILRPDEADERRALALFEKYADQRVSFTDCLSFALMLSHRIDRVFTFDHHFAVAGFTTLPGWSVHEPGPEAQDLTTASAPDSGGSSRPG